MVNPPSRRRRSTALLCVALLADDSRSVRAYQCCASSSSRRRSRLASPRLCDDRDRQALGDPATILGFGEALRQGDVSPQLELGSMPPTISQGIDGLEMLREDELRQLEALEEPAAPMLSPACQARARARPPTARPALVATPRPCTRTHPQPRPIPCPNPHDNPHPTTRTPMATRS